MSLNQPPPPLPHVQVRIVPTHPHQVILPQGIVTVHVGDTIECVVNDTSFRIHSYVVTEQMRDADKVRFAELERLYNENRILQARVGNREEAVAKLEAALLQANADIRRMRAAMEVRKGLDALAGDYHPDPSPDPYRPLAQVWPPIPLPEEGQTIHEEGGRQG